MNNVEINPTNEFHLLRHFIDVSSEYRNSLIGKEYYRFNFKTQKFEKSFITPIDIDNALKTTGSKFYKNVKGIEDPQKLLKLIVSEFYKLNERIWTDCENGKNLGFLFKYSQYVGERNLIHIKELTNEERKRVKKVPRGESESEIMINVVSNVKVRRLDTIEVSLLDSPKLPSLFVTAYPGDLMPTEDFPNKLQKKENYKKSKEFWDNHVFIINDRL